MEFLYPAKLKRTTAGNVVVTFRDVPEAMTQGRSVSEALEMAAGALQAAIETRMEDGLDVPPAYPGRKGDYIVAVPIGTALKAALYCLMREQGLTKSEVARLLNVDTKEVRRFLDVKHPTKADRLEDVLHRFGKRVTVRVEEVDNHAR